MGLVELKEEILLQAKDKAKSIENEAKSLQEQQFQATAKEIAALEETERHRFSLEGEELSRRELASARAQTKRRVQEEKKKLIDECFTLVRREIEKLSDQRRSEMIKPLLERSKASLDVAKVYCDPKDRKLFAPIPAESKEMLGGFIAENRDGTVRDDMRFETLLESVRDRSIEEIGGRLFK